MTAIPQMRRQSAHATRVCESVQPEEKLARSVVTEMQRQGWDVYQEVSTGRGARRADIVGVRCAATMVVECKARLSLKLLDQMVWWRGYANYVVGAYGGGRMGHSVQVLCQSEGLGLWAVYYDEITEKVSPRFQRRSWDGLKKSLRPEHQSAEYAKAGSRGGGYFTPFRGTCDELLRVVQATPGISLREAMVRVKHHYSNQRSAVSSLPGLIRGGHVPGIRIDDERPLKLYPTREGHIGGHGAVAEWEPVAATAWECGCGHRNGINLATCAVCNRRPGATE